MEVKVPETLGGGVFDYLSYSQLTLLVEKTDYIKSRAVIELKNQNYPKAKLGLGLTFDHISPVTAHDVNNNYQTKISENQVLYSECIYLAKSG